MINFYRFIHSWAGFAVFISGMAIVYFGTSWLYNQFVFTDKMKSHTSRYYKRLKRVKAEWYMINSILESIKKIKIDIDNMMKYHERIDSLFLAYSRALNNLLVVIQYANTHTITDDEKENLSRISKSFLNTTEILFDSKLRVRHFGRHSKFANKYVDLHVDIKDKESVDMIITNILSMEFNEISKLNRTEESCARDFIRRIENDLNKFITKYEIDGTFSDIENYIVYNKKFITNTYTMLESAVRDKMCKSNLITNSKKVIEQLESPAEYISYNLLKEMDTSTKYVDILREIVGEIICRFIDEIDSVNVDIYLTKFIPAIVNVNNNAYDDNFPQEDLGLFDYETLSDDVDPEKMEKIKNLEMQYMDYIKAAIIEGDDDNEDSCWL